MFDLQVSLLSSVYFLSRDRLSSASEISLPGELNQTSYMAHETKTESEVGRYIAGDYNVRIQTRLNMPYKERSTQELPLYINIIL